MRGESILDYPGESNVITGILKRERGRIEREMDMTEAEIRKERRCYVAWFADEKTLPILDF